jgi:hypothetical protein
LCERELTVTKRSDASMQNGSVPKTQI